MNNSTVLAVRSYRSLNRHRDEAQEELALEHGRKKLSTRFQYSGSNNTERCHLSTLEDIPPNIYKIWLAHAMLFLLKGPGVGIGTVVVKIGLVHTNPLVFAFLRNAISAMILLPLSFAMDKATLQMKHVPVVLASCHSRGIVYNPYGTEETREWHSEW